MTAENPQGMPLIPIFFNLFSGLHLWLIKILKVIPVVGPPMSDLLSQVPMEIIYYSTFVILAFLVTQAVALIGGIMTFLERRIAGRIQFRIGPNRVGPQGILQFLADGIKLILKEDLIPDEADKPLFRIAPYLVVVGTFLAFVCLPITSTVILSDINMGIFYILAVTSFVVIGIIMSGWASNSKWSLLGALRSAAQIIAYEIPVGLAVLAVIFYSGSLSMQEIIQSQGAWPWQWNMFANPFLLISVFIYFTGALAENNRTPFDIPEAESELVSGYNTEYSGIRFGFFFMAEFANVFLISAICTTLFLGGWNIPFQVSHPLLKNILEASVFLLKSGILVFLVLQLRWTLPRLRVDQLMSACWKYLVPIAFMNILGTTLWMVLWPKGIWWVKGLLTLFIAAVVINFIRHVFRNLKAVSGTIRWNPLS